MRLNFFGLVKRESFVLKLVGGYPRVRFHRETGKMMPNGQLKERLRLPIFGIWCW
jgi:hypothetical protein